MEFKEYLVSKGVTDEQATQIVSGVPENEFYLASEEKLDERYTKLKEQKEQADEDLKSANELVDSLKKSNKSNEDLQSEIDDYKEKLDELDNQRTKDRLESAVELGLTKAGARDNKSAKVHLDLDKLELTDDGVKGLEEQIKGLQEERKFLFENSEDANVKNPRIVKGGSPKGSNSDVKNLADMSYEEVLELKESNPKQFEESTKQ